MEAPFIFGKICRNSEFTNRKKETKELVINFKSGISTILISPRRWGKSSLVEHSAKEYLKHNRKDKVVFIDLFNSKNEKEFYSDYINKILNATGGKFERIRKIATEFLGSFMPIISIGTEPNVKVSVTLDWEKAKENPDDIISLPERIAEKQNIRIIVCIDEFQNIHTYENPLALQKKLRSHWQKHQNVTYVLYGSKRSLMSNIFTNPTMPLYKFGHLIFLDKIEYEDWKKFIVKRFKDTGKNIDSDMAGIIAGLAANHPFYVQQLAQLSWLRTESDKKCDINTINDAAESLMLQLSYIFQNIIDSLPTQQLNVLHAIANHEEKLSSEKTMKKYNLKSSAHVSQALKALINKDILDYHLKRYEFNDPIFQAWIKLRFNPFI